MSVCSHPGVITGIVDMIQSSDDSCFNKLIENPVYAFAGDRRQSTAHCRPDRIHIRMRVVSLQKLVDGQTL